MNEEIFYRKNSTGHLFAMCSNNGWHVFVTNVSNHWSIQYHDWVASEEVLCDEATKDEFCNAYNAVYCKLINKVML